MFNHNIISDQLMLQIALQIKGHIPGRKGFKVDFTVKGHIQRLHGRSGLTADSGNGQNGKRCLFFFKTERVFPGAFFGGKQQMHTVFPDDTETVIVVTVSLPEITQIQFISLLIDNLYQIIFTVPRISQAQIVPSSGTIHGQHKLSALPLKSSGNISGCNSIDLVDRTVVCVERIR